MAQKKREYTEIKTEYKYLIFSSAIYFFVKIFVNTEP